MTIGGYLWKVTKFIVFLSAGAWCLYGMLTVPNPLAVFFLLLGGFGNLIKAYSILID
ncbi:hypothetical protein [Spirosoma aerophilum]